MSTMEVRVIDEGTAEFELDHACPLCEGTLELRVSADGAWTFCSTCRLISHPRVFKHPEHGYSLQFPNAALA